jgi:hypothetical protein
MLADYCAVLWMVDLAGPLDWQKMLVDNVGSLVGQQTAIPVPLSLSLSDSSS